jgi:hypothetical protein
MSSDERKLQLIEEVLKVQNESVLIELETVIKKAGQSKDQSRPSARDFSGVWSKEDADLIEKAIAEGCEQINPDDWK